jgi:hypothetical protein
MAANPLSSTNQRPVLEYAVAVLSVAAAFLVRYACDGWLGDRSALDFFLAATAVSAWYGGVGPSVFSIVLSTLLGLWFFVPPRRTLVVTEVVDLIEPPRSSSGSASRISLRDEQAPPGGTRRRLIANSTNASGSMGAPSPTSSWR